MDGGTSRRVARERRRIREIAGALAFARLPAHRPHTANLASRTWHERRRRVRPARSSSSWPPLARCGCPDLVQHSLPRQSEAVSPNPVQSLLRGKVKRSALRTGAGRSAAGATDPTSAARRDRQGGRVVEALTISSGGTTRATRPVVASGSAPPAALAPLTVSAYCFLIGRTVAAGRALAPLAFPRPTLSGAARRTAATMARRRCGAASATARRVEASVPLMRRALRVDDEPRRARRRARARGWPAVQPRRKVRPRPRSAARRRLASAAAQSWPAATPARTVRSHGWWAGTTLLFP